MVAVLVDLLDIVAKPRFIARLFTLLRREP